MKVRNFIQSSHHFDQIWEYSVEITGNPYKKSRTPEPKISLKNEKSRTLNLKVIFLSFCLYCMAVAYTRELKFDNKMQDNKIFSLYDMCARTNSVDTSTRPKNYVKLNGVWG